MLQYVIKMFMKMKTFTKVCTGTKSYLTPVIIQKIEIEISYLKKQKALIKYCWWWAKILR